MKAADKGPPTKKADQITKVIFVNGTSTGLGMDNVIQAAMAGHIVYATMRDLARRDQLDKAAAQAGVSLNVRQLDVQNSTSANVLKHVAATGGMLDNAYLPILQKYIGGAQNRQGGEDMNRTANAVAAVVMTCVDAEGPPVHLGTSIWAEAITRLKTEIDLTGTKQQAPVIKQFLS